MFHFICRGHVNEEKRGEKEDSGGWGPQSHRQWERHTERQGGDRDTHRDTRNSRTEKTVERRRGGPGPGNERHAATQTMVGGKAKGRHQDRE